VTAAELVAAGYGWEQADAPVLHDALNLADLAHAVELVSRGVVPGDAGTALLGALLDLAALPAEAVDYDPAYGEVYDARERHLASRIGTDAGWLRAGRTRREAVRTAFRIRLRHQVLDLAAAAATLATTLADRAESHVDTLMPDHTYLQPAQATTFGHYLLSFADPVLRDARRLLAELDHVNASPAGCGAVNGSRILDDRDGTARALGFHRAVEHTRDAMWQTDPFVHVLAAATTLVVGQDKLAEDLEIFASVEFGFVELGDEYSRPSILMPQKRNPYALTVIRGSAGVLIGRLTGQLAVAKSPSARSDNLIYAYGEVPRALDLAHRVTCLTAGVVRTLRPDTERMRAAAGVGFTQAADLAELLMQRFGADYRTAHQVVRRAGSPDAAAVAAASSEVVGTAWTVDDAELAKLLDARALVDSRTSLGGAAAVAMEPMLAGVRSRAGSVTAETVGRRTAIGTAENALRARATELAGR
jgi:argininosuccinate lyase